METDAEAIWRQAEFEEARDRAQAGLDRINDALAERAERGASASQWSPPEPAPVQRQSQPEPKPRAEMSPPWPDKVQIVKHDAAGRAVALVTYEGAMSIKQALGWESWVDERIKAAIDRRTVTFAEQIGEALGEEIAKEAREERARTESRLVEQVNRLEAMIAQLQSRLEQAEARAAGRPRLVEDDAAD